MAEYGDHLADTEVIHVLTLGVAPYAEPKYAGEFPAQRLLHRQQRARRGERRPAPITRRSSSPRSRGCFARGGCRSTSPWSWSARRTTTAIAASACPWTSPRPAVESAKLVIAQVNRHMPRTHGDCFLNVRQIHYLVEHDEPLLEWPVVGEPDEVTRQIADAPRPPGPRRRHAAARHRPHPRRRRCRMLTDKNDLGIHTEMFSDGVLKLARAGVITGKYKTLHPGKIVGSFAAGSHELFEFMHDNPQIEMHPSDYTNDPLVISGQDNMVAINAALEVDLTGQVVADSLGQLLYSGIGGHADFIRGAALAKNGKPIIAMPSTADTPEGVKSRIVATLQEGAGVITTRGDTHYIVTEYGVAYLHGKTMRERAMSLISIAHPDFRAELLHAAKRRHIVYRQPDHAAGPGPLPGAVRGDHHAAAPARRSSCGPIRPDDEPMMQRDVLLLQRADQVPALPRRPEVHAAQQAAGVLQRRLRHRDGPDRPERPARRARRSSASAAT